jgi:hypothetical protein
MLYRTRVLNDSDRITEAVGSSSTFRKKRPSRQEHAMGDNLRRYRAIRAALIQGYSGQPTGKAWRGWGDPVHSGRMAHIHYL